MKIISHKDLKVWQESMTLVENIYKITSEFPKEEMYGLTSQIKRASISVPSNIAEGAGRKSNVEYMRFLYIALGSLSELETQLEIAVRLSFTSHNESIEKQIYFIKVKQIRNLQEYFSGKKLAGHERILKVKDLKTIDFRWN